MEKKAMNKCSSYVQLSEVTKIVFFCIQKFRSHAILSSSLWFLRLAHQNTYEKHSVIELWSGLSLKSVWSSPNLLSLQSSCRKQKVVSGDRYLKKKVCNHSLLEQFRLCSVYFKSNILHFIVNNIQYHLIKLFLLVFIF